MKYVNTGKGRITVLTLLAIWSISLVVDLPGLAITPMMGDLTRIFPGATHLEIQLLSILPNFCIIPFILLSGRLSMSRNKESLINLGLLVFLLSGIAYFFAKSMLALIVISCVLGIGCGFVIPLAAGVIADHFTGVERMRQMGIKSGIANFTLIFATMVVGWIKSTDWHSSFFVYLIPVIPLALSPFLSGGYLKRTTRPAATTEAGSEIAGSGEVPASAAATSSAVSSAAASTVTPADAPLQRARRSDRSRMRNIWGIMGFYFAITICTITISYYMPFVMQDNGMGTSATGIVTAIFFLFITLAGFTLPYMVRWMRNRLTLICMVLMIGGLVLVALFHSLLLYIVAVVAIGFGYGLLQPIFYNKASLLAKNDKSATNAISYIMAANYFGTAVTPLVFTGIGSLFGIRGHVYTFWLGIAFLSVVFILALLYRRSYVFYTSLSDS